MTIPAPTEQRRYPLKVASPILRYHRRFRARHKSPAAWFAKMIAARTWGPGRCTWRYPRRGAYSSSSGCSSGGARPSRPLSSSSSVIRSDRDLGVVGIDRAARSADQRHRGGLRLVDLDIFLQRVNQFLAQVVRRDGHVGDLAQRHHRVLVVVALDGDRCAGRYHARPVTRQQHEIKPVFNLVDAVFNGNAGHAGCSCKGTCVEIWRLGIRPASQAQAKSWEERN